MGLVAGEWPPRERNVAEGKAAPPAPTRGELGGRRDRVNVIGTMTLRSRDVFDGDITVHGAGVLRLYGTLDGQLRVQAGGTAIVRGLVTGDVINSGGRVLMFGTVAGRVHQLGGRTQFLTIH